MKKLFNIQWITYLVLILAALCGQFQPIFLFLVLSFIHEMGHFFACRLFKIKVNRIDIMPFGCRMEIANIENSSATSQIWIYLAGPAMFFVNFLLIQLCFKIGWISQHTFAFLNDANKIISLFNLLPIYPLDGYQIIKGFLSLIVPFKTTLSISITISLIGFCFFVIYNFFHLQLFLLLFLFLEQIKHLHDYKKMYQRFLIFKTRRKKYKHFKIIHNHFMYKDKNNYLITENKIYDDVDIAYEELKNISAHKR